jgi:ACR3 family arsenite efflux pump ArsB
MSADRPALRYLAWYLAHCSATGVLAGAAASVYWRVLPAPLTEGQIAFGLAIAASVMFFGQSAAARQQSPEKEPGT